MSDVAKILKLPVLIVARPDLGTINHTLLTINHAVEKGLKVSGVIINRYPENTDDIAIKTAPRLIEEYSDVSVVGIVKDFGSAASIKPATLIDSMLNSIDLEKIFGIKIPKLNIGL
jgi:dethiobiotin synthetase